MRNIDIKSDLWILPYHNISLTSEWKIDFTLVNNPILKRQMKQVIGEILKHDVLETSSIVSYYAKFVYYFQPFLELHNIDINYFSDLTKEIINMYTLHLLTLENISKDTKILGIMALKSIVKYGNLYQLNNFPSDNIFEKNYSDIFGIDDTLETKAISPNELETINKNLNLIKNPWLKAAIIIARDTGLRISSIFHIQKGCVLEDFSGHPILYTYIHKTDEEFYTPITNDVKKCIEDLEKVYVPNEGGFLFFKNPENKNPFYSQSQARADFKKFLKKIGLENSDISFHSFRHTIGDEMLNNGATTEQVATQLHHKSLHSTNIYAKMNDKTVENEYRKIPALGLSLQKENNVECDNNPCYSGSLPDGYCKSICSEDGSICDSFNRCLFCGSFQTFKKDLPTHKLHLKRIQEDAYKYMQEEGVPSIEILFEIEQVLMEIIARLENE